MSGAAGWLPGTRASLVKTVRRDWMSLNNRVRCCAKLGLFGYGQAAKSSAAVGLGRADARVVERLHPAGGQDVVDQRAQPAEVHVPPRGHGEQTPHQGAGVVTGLGRGDEVAVDLTTTVAERVVEVPRDDASTAR